MTGIPQYRQWKRSRTLALIATVRPTSLYVAGPFAAAWICAPWIVWQADLRVFGRKTERTVVVP